MVNVFLPSKTYIFHLKATTGHVYSITPMWDWAPRQCLTNLHWLEIERWYYSHETTACRQILSDLQRQWGEEGRVFTGVGVVFRLSLLENTSVPQYPYFCYSPDPNTRKCGHCTTLSFWPPVYTGFQCLCFDFGSCPSRSRRREFGKRSGISLESLLWQLTVLFNKAGSCL